MQNSKLSVTHIDPEKLRASVKVILNPLTIDTGTLSVGSASLGWTEPIRVERLFLKGTDETIVLSVPLIETEAHLWSLVAGRSGLGALSMA